MRPADIDAPDWVPLFAAAIGAGVFTEAEQFGMLKAMLECERPGQTTFFI
jgi:hypothetical protein